MDRKKIYGYVRCSSRDQSVEKGQVNAIQDEKTYV